MEKIDTQFIKIIGRQKMPKPIFYILNICTFGILYLVCRMSIRLSIFFKTTSSTISEADCVIVEDCYGQKSLIKVEKINVNPTLELKRYILNNQVCVINTPYGRFILDHISSKYERPIFYRPSTTNVPELILDSIMKSKEESKLELFEKEVIFGKNDLGVQTPSILCILEKHLLDPFFLFEVFSFTLWMAIAYYRYAIVVGSIYAFLFLKRVGSDLRHRSALLKMNTESFVTILRDNSFTKVPEENILPGDIILVEKTDSFSCDCEILMGEVISDESFLNGECVPIFKSPGHFVYSGTKIVKSSLGTSSIDSFVTNKLVNVKNLTDKESKKAAFIENTDFELPNSAIAIVLKTGRSTKRGMLSRNLTIRRPSVNIFSKQSLKVIKWLIISSVILTISIIIYLSQYLNWLRNLEFSLDLALAFFSPAILFSLELGAQYARDQLFKKQVNTTETERINTAGEVDMVVFDKTGTLTELGVDILNIDTIDTVIESINEITSILHLGISTCHYVLELDNQYSGDILDMKMFLFSKSTIINKNCRRFIDLSPNNECYPVCKEQSIDSNSDSVLYFNSIGSKARGENMVEVMKIHDFDPYLKRMSSVVKCSDEKMYLFCKGAPDSLYKILKSVPEGYKEKVKEYGLQGHRVLTLAYKEITEYGKREVDEQDLVFAGFIVFANKLKEETEGVIRELREANIKPKMCTGDNILTAISVARECGMIDSGMPVLFPVIEDNLKSYHDAEWFCVADENYIFDKIKMQLYMDSDRTTSVDFVVAIEGKEFESFRHTVYHPFILEMGVVFARFNPENKKDLVEDYSNNDYVTMFCGDGANDTGALSAADVGLSLALNEASLAASFNSTKITSVLDLIKEGRSALAMSAAQFKYVLYSQIISGIQMVVLLPLLCFPSDMMSLANDIMSVYIFGYALANFKASNIIKPGKISINLIFESFLILCELLFTTTVFFIVVLLCGWPSEMSDINTKSIHSTVVYPSTYFLLILKCFNLANFRNHRQNRKSNHIFILIMSTAILFGGFLIWSIYTGFKPICDSFSFAVLESDDRIRMLVSLSLTLLINLGFNFLV